MSRPASQRIGRLPLTLREAQALELARHGLSAAEVARVLGVGEPRARRLLEAAEVKAGLRDVPVPT